MEFQILEAAEKLFLEQGFAKTTTGQIANLAACNQALVHYYYRTKDKLFERIFDEKIKLLVSNFINVKTEGNTFEERLKVMIESHFEFLENNPKLPPFIYRELSDNLDRAKMLIERIRTYPENLLTMMKQELEAEKAKGTIRDIAPIDLIISIISLNVMPFLMKPIFQFALNTSDKQIEKIMKNRKKEIVDMVLARLRA
ncbi:MAG: TetR family transcriptional regulator [Bacteroidales bacterium]|nr:TetR family transcriptional regulator [Bacteroidales bacterium]